MRVFLGVPARVACRCVIAFCFVLFQSSRRPPISRKSNQLSGLLVPGDGKQAKKAKSTHNRKMFAAAGCPFSLGPSDRLQPFLWLCPKFPSFFFRRSTCFSVFARFCASNMPVFLSLPPTSPNTPQHPQHPQTNSVFCKTDSPAT